MITRRKTAVLARLILFAVVVCTGLAVPPAHAGDGVGQVAKVRGEVVVMRSGADSPAAVGSALQLRDTIKTGGKSRAQIQFIDGSMVTLGENSALSIDRFVVNAAAKSRNVALSALGGLVNAVATKSGESAFDYQIRTGNGYSAVRGTNWVIAAQAGTTTVYVLDGLVEVGTKTGSRAVVERGQSVTISASGISGAQPIAPDVMQQVLDATDVASTNAAPDAAAPAVQPAPAQPDSAPDASPAPKSKKSGGGNGGGGGGGGHGM